MYKVYYHAVGFIVSSIGSLKFFLQLRRVFAEVKLLMSPDLQRHKFRLFQFEVFSQTSTNDDS